MPRGALSLPESDGEAIRLFTEQHIIQVRRSEKTGRILEVDHVEFGWMKPEAFYKLQKVHDLQPVLEKVIEGGYRAKAALWSTQVTVGPVTIPAVAALVSGAFLASMIHRAAGKEGEAFLDIASLFLPFGEIWLLYSGFSFLPDIEEIAETVESGLEGLVAGSKEATEKELQMYVRWFETVNSWFRALFAGGGPLPPIQP